MQRRIRLISAALAATTALGLLPSTPAVAAPQPAQLHTFGSNGQLNTSEQFAPPGATPVIGAFDAELGDDIIWYTPGAGGDAFWSSNQDGTWTASALSVSGTYTPYVGSFGGHDDGLDVLWYSTTGASQLWDFQDPEGGLVKTPLPTVTGTGTILIGDFTTDGATDIVRYRPGAPVEQWWDFDHPEEGTGPDLTTRTFSVGGTYTPIVGAFHTDTISGDYGADILWYAPGSTADSLWDFDPHATFTKTALAINGTFTPIVAQWVADAAADILWYAPGAAADSLWDFNEGTNTVQKTPLTINGTYTPYACSCFNSGSGDRWDILWHGVGNAPDALWSIKGSTFSPTSYSYPGTSIRGSKVVLPSLDGDRYQAVISYG
ncbi:MAG TPA: hypothetical protein VF228_12810 [Iamia sp.]